MESNGWKRALMLGGILSGAAACAVFGSNDSRHEDDIAETNDLFGDDRVADVLRPNLAKVPSTFQQVESLFGIGRSCSRTDTKEIYVIEDEQSRSEDGIATSPFALPRAVITGCNTPEHGPPPGIRDPHWGSYSLMVALFSDDELAAGGETDMMVLDHVEAMALDRRTGLYNFYVFKTLDDPSDGKGGVIQRIRLLPDDSVVVYEKRPRSARVSTSKAEDNRRCADCHVNMGPLMNEFSEPWTNWVSTHKALPPNVPLSGETRSIVSESASMDRTHGRLSFANDLERILTSAIAVWNDGLPREDGTPVPGTGFVQANLDGDQSKRLGGLLKSVFCETELRYTTGFETVPLEMFVDPFIFGSALVRPPLPSLDSFPILMPVRSEMDKRIERGLQNKGVLSFATVTAVRLFDDRNDIFSAARCGLYPHVLGGLPTDTTKVDVHVRDVLRRHVDERVPQGTRREYVNALLDDSPGARERISSARSAYLAETVPQVNHEFDKVSTAEGRAELKRRSNSRKEDAKRMFPGEDRVPLPPLSPEK